jgi:hypothetical protein
MRPARFAVNLRLVVGCFDIESSLIQTGSAGAAPVVPRSV